MRNIFCFSNYKFDYLYTNGINVFLLNTTIGRSGKRSTVWRMPNKSTKRKNDDNDLAHASEFIFHCKVPLIGLSKIVKIRQPVLL